MARPRHIIEAPYWEPGTLPYEARHRLQKRLKDSAPEFLEQARQWRRLRQQDLEDIDGLDRKAAEDRSWVEVSLLYPPPGIQAKRPTAVLVACPDPKREPEPCPVATKKAAERVRRLVEGIGKIAPEVVKEEKEVLYLDDKLFDVETFSTDSPEEFIRDTLWVFNHLQRRCKPESAPSPGAWSMLLFARENQDKFFGGIYPKTLDYAAKLRASQQAHERELKKLEVEAELEAHRANQMTDEEAADLAETLDLCKELGVPVREVAKGIRMTKEPPPELAARMEV